MNNTGMNGRNAPRTNDPDETREVAGPLRPYKNQRASSQEAATERDLLAKLGLTASDVKRVRVSTVKVELTWQEAREVWDLLDTAQYAQRGTRRELALIARAKDKLEAWRAGR